MRKARWWTTDWFFGLLVGGVGRLKHLLSTARRALVGGRGKAGGGAVSPAGLGDPEQRLKRAEAVSGTATPAGQAAAVPRRIGPYLIERELGKGAMGVIYLGRDSRGDRVAAIKTLALAQRFSADELAEVKQRFFREAETVGRLDHPNIVAMYDSGEAPELAYMAMEFLRGRDLMPFTKPGQLLPLARVVSIIARVADALAYAHVNNVVHRDVKPGNVMYDPGSDQVKVTDFGVARLTDSSKTMIGMVLGTPNYMSPEQLSGKKVDGRSDLFSLGVTLYQLACGELPFSGDSMAQVMFRIANEAQPDVRTKNSLLPDALAAVIDRALDKDLTRRYQSADEMAFDLRACRVSAAARHSDLDILS